jgi:signal transduction histidine kinase
VTLRHQASLEQVLVNLLLNAADALRGRPPGAPRHIRIAAEVGPTDGMLRLMVADSGRGIPEAVLPRLFEPLVSTKDDAPVGTGLGLSICHGLVTAMGGGIVARNEAVGAVFSVDLPRALAGGST